MRAADFDQIIVVDIETTGLGPGARPVEVAWIQVDHDLNEVARAGSLVNPGMPIEPGASAVNGITDAMVAESPTLEHLVRSIHGDPFAAGRTLVIAHNAPFDSPHFAPFFDTSESLCTMRLSRHLLADFDNYRLDTLCTHLGLSGTQDHRAMGDTEMCLALMKHLADHHEDGIDGLLALSGRALFEMNMPFGKHKNTPIADLPSSYVKWMRSEMDDLDGDLLACLDLHHSSA
jgi:DNA polymerase III epsilon subunit-like protein